jgi:hypothetical protein
MFILLTQINQSIPLKEYTNMKFNSIYKNIFIAGSIVIITTPITGCGTNVIALPDSLTSSTFSSLVRIIHASADAPPVDIKLDNAVAVPAPPGDYDIRVVTDGGAGMAEIDAPAFNLAAGSVSTVFAREPVSGGGTPDDFNLIVLSNPQLINSLKRATG